MCLRARFTVRHEKCMMMEINVVCWLPVTRKNGNERAEASLAGGREAYFVIRRTLRRIKHVIHMYELF